MWFLCLCKLTQVFSVVLVLNISPSGSTYQLSLVHWFVSFSLLFPPLSPSPFCSLHLTQNCFIWHRLLMFYIYLSLCPPSSILLLCILLHDSLSCGRSFGCHPCASQFPSSLSIYISSSFLPDYSLSPVSPFITSAQCEFYLPPFFLFLSEPKSVCLSQVWVSYFDFISLSPCSLLLPSSLWCLFTWRGMKVGLSVWIDGWREAMGERIWALSVRILLKELDRSLLWKGVGDLLAILRYSPLSAHSSHHWCPFCTHWSKIISIIWVYRSQRAKSKPFFRHLLTF